MTKEKIAIVTDSCGDLPKDLADKMNITIVPLHVVFGEKMYQDGVDLMSAQFYEMLATAEELPTTTQPSPEEFKKVYEHLLETHDRIISIHISQKLSGTLQSANIASKFFGDKVIIWDTEFVSNAIGMQACAAAEAVQNGATVEEVMVLLHNVRDTTEMLFSLDTLEYLRKGGRIGAAASLLGSVFKIKPLIIVRDGYYHAFGKERSKKKALKRMLDHFIAINKERPVKRFVLGQGMAEDVAKMAQEILEKEFGIKATFNSFVGPVIGTHVGPGVYGIAVSHY